MSFPVDKNKVIFYVVLTVCSFVSAKYGQPLIHGNEAAITVIVTTFSILAGFLIAIIAILGDPVSLVGGSWRNAEIEGKKAFKRLLYHKILFFMYLITLGLIFLSFLVKDNLPTVTVGLEQIYLFFSVFAFIQSLTLPAALMKLQRERIESIITSRREASGIKEH